MAVSDIASNGWLQGSVMDASILRIVFPHIQVLDDDVGVLMTHSCDLRHHDIDAEPSVEIALGRRVANCSVEYQNVRNPRLLDVLAASGEAYHFAAKEISTFPRAKLAEFKPSTAVRLGEGLEVLLRWRSNRFLRVARPDSFNRAIALKRKELVRWLKRANATVEEIRLRFDPPGELYSGQRYQAQFILLAGGKPGDVERDTELSRLSQELAVVLEHCGICPYGDHDMVTFGYLDEITVAEYREFIPFELGDHLTVTGREFAW